MLNAGLVAALALMAGGTAPSAAALALAMLGIQFSIGAVNDLVDEPLDALVKPSKPLITGAISKRATIAIAVLPAVAALLISAAFGPVVLVLAIGMLAAGLAYDLVLKPTPLAGVAFALAFPLLPIFAWWGVTGTLPPAPEFLLPVAAMAGPTLQLANGLVDLERDKLTGLRGPVVALGRGRAILALIVAEAIIHGLAIITLVGGTTHPAALLLVLAGNLSAAVGVFLSTRRRPATRETGWRAQALAIALLGAGWVLAFS